MRIQSSVWQVACIAAFWLGVAAGALADPPDLLSNYRFIPSETSVHVSGGLPAYNLNLTIAGRFGLVTGYDEVVSPTTKVPSLVPHAEFIDVHGILFNPLSLAPLPLPGWDLDQTLNFSGLHGTFSVGDPGDLFFLGGDGQGVALRLQATINGGWLHLTGGSSDPVGKNPVLYQIDALAHLAPFPDFNQDGAVTSADLQPMLTALSQMSPISAASSFADADLLSLGDVNGDGVFNNADVQSLLDMLKTAGTSLAAVPEPATFVLMALALPGLAFAVTRRCRG
jgi:hypothetical protein